MFVSNVICWGKTKLWVKKKKWELKQKKFGSNNVLGSEKCVSKKKCGSTNVVVKKMNIKDKVRSKFVWGEHFFI